MNQISPSILSADFSNLISDINRVSNAQMLHVDVMDGHFVPNITVGIPVVASLKKATRIPLDVHLMISDPILYVEAFANAGADMICFHAEAQSNVRETIKKIKACGKKVGIAIRPKTDVSVLSLVIEEVDMVLIMTVEPGFAGQAFMPETLLKVKKVKEMAEAKNLKVDIQVDGGINLETAQLCVQAGANILVAGSFVFGSRNPDKVVRQLQQVM